jgi:hypothetical protein
MLTLGALALTTAVVFLLRHVWYHRYVLGELDAALTERDRETPGWRLHELEAARATVSNADNGATLVLASTELLGKRWPTRTEVADLFKNVDVHTPLSGPQANTLRAEMTRVRLAVVAARKLDGKATGRYPIRYNRDPLGTLLPHLDRVRRTAALLRYDGWLRVHDRDWAGAAVSCRATFAAAQSIGDEPVSLSQAMRSACALDGCRLVERVLGQGVMNDADLAKLQRLLAEEDNHPGLLISLRSDLAMTHELLDGYETGEVPLARLAEEYPGWHDAWTGLSVVDRLKGDHAKVLPLLAAYIAFAHRPDHEHGDAVRELEARAETIRPSPALRLVPSLSKLDGIFRRLHARLRCLRTALAAERYRLGHGDWPMSLDSLTPDLLAAVPVDPFDGKPLRYRRLVDGIVVYSVGPDGEDNEGNLDENAETPGTDVGCRLWNVSMRATPRADR